MAAIKLLFNQKINVSVEIFYEARVIFKRWYHWISCITNIQKIPWIATTSMLRVGQARPVPFHDFMFPHFSRGGGISHRRQKIFKN